MELSAADIPADLVQAPTPDEASMMDAEIAPQPSQDTEPDVPGHIPMSTRLALVSWGEGSQPSLPSIDDASSVMSIDDRGSSLESFKSSTMSVRSSVYDFVKENGRTYHRYKEGKYLLPNDEQEQERLDLQHALFLFTIHGDLFLAPIGDTPQRVLDIATGTGIWAIEFAQKFPGSHVVGTDLSPIQPNYVPSNCVFEVDDAEDEPWTFSTKFDYIHGRALATCFKDPSVVLKQAFDALEPGGYLEFQDAAFPFSFAGEVDTSSAFYRWSQLLGEGGQKSGRPWTNVPNYRRWMEAIGFADVSERTFYWPVGTWAKGEYYKTCGAWFQEDLLHGLEGISLKVLGLLGWSREDIGTFLVDVRRELENPTVRAYIPIIFVYGRKPPPPEETEVDMS